VKVGDLIYWHGRNTIALVINIMEFPDPTGSTKLGEHVWYCLLDSDDGMITHDYLEEGYTIINESWNWPDWHINHEDNR
jgi:hypothetical protein